MLALKHLGLSLGEATTADHISFSKEEMVNVLQIQKTIIQNKIHSMKTLLDTIVVTEKSIKETSELDWSKIIDVIQLLVSEKELRQKYRDLSNLNAEIKLIDRFSLEQNGWYRWVYEQLGLQDQSKVLEIGCGNGALWFKNMDQIPHHLNVTLTEECEDMLKNSQQNIGNNFPRFKFKKINLNKLPFPEESFDVIVANHILFYVKNIDEVLAEIFRVLKTNGYFYCSTM